MIDEKGFKRATIDAAVDIAVNAASNKIIATGKSFDEFAEAYIQKFGVMPANIYLNFAYKILINKNL